MNDCFFNLSLQVKLCMHMWRLESAREAYEDVTGKNYIQVKLF